MDIRTAIATNGGDWNSKYGEIWKAHLAKLQEKFGGAIEEVRAPIDTPTDVPIVFVKKDQVLEVMRFLKDSLEYGFLSDLTATDEEVEPRFEVVYNLFSHTTKARIRIKCRLREGEEIASMVPLWRGADWAEREVWDMFGVRFKGHPDLRRILMDERWEGHPLRKDYPLRGYQVFTDPMAPREELLD